MSFTELPFQLTGDQIRLKQVLINLIKNLAKIAGVIQIRIRVSYDYVAQQIHVHITDTTEISDIKSFGSSFRDQEMQSFTDIFDVETNLSQDMIASHKVTAGLFICKDIIRMSGG